MVEPPAILLIEDEPLLLHNLQMLLQHEGYRVRATCGGAEGIKQLEAQAFDLVITDLVMPGIDGFQVLDYLKNHHPETVVVTVTGYISSASASEALRRGAYENISKPFDYHRLKATIERALGQARRQQPAGEDERTGEEDEQAGRGAGGSEPG
jgi:two-component system, OmpR family, phosphate regulon sensor histidine kinase PhoR